jgi:phosphatidylinositol alpha-mannosyltransferase
MNGRPLRILQVSDAYYPFPGGVSEHLHHLTRSLRDRGHDVKILTTSYGPEDAKFSDGVYRLGHCRILPSNKTQATLAFAWNLPVLVRNFMARHRFDVVHTHGSLAVNLPHLAFHYSRSRNVATFHTAFVGWNWHKVGKIFFKKGSKRMDAFIPVSKVALETIRPHYPYGDYRIVPNGVDIRRFRPDLPPIERMASLPNPKVLFVGRLEPRKGLDHLIRAFPMVVREVPDAVLFVVGSGPLEAQYRRMIPDELRDSIHFEGFVSVEDLPRYYKSADLYTSPAVGGETFGIVLVEAMASGTPVAASNIPGYRQVIRDGENGLLFDFRDPALYARILVKGLRERTLRERLVEEGLKTAQQLSWERIAGRIEEIYFEILEE